MSHALCLHNHNDTWDLKGGKKVEVSRIIKILKETEVFTVVVESLLQAANLFWVDFLIELFKECKTRNTHLYWYFWNLHYNADNKDYIQKLDRKTLELTDLIMLDIKHIDPRKTYAFNRTAQCRDPRFFKISKRKKYPRLDGACCCAECRR